LKVWRWIFIVVQTAVFVSLSLAATLELGFGISLEPQPESLAIALGVSYMVALLFLLIASPFFFKSLGKLAVIGWIVTFAILVISMCFPARA
jgi:positive regulator of sigma E activity